MNKKNVKDIDLKNKKVLVRVDFNVPLDENLNITSDKRIIAAVPTIEYLLEQNAAIILMSHLGRPKGEFVEKMSLKPVAKRLQEIFKDRKIIMADDCIGEKVESLAKNLKSGEILLLENLRFYKEEEKNDPFFAKKLASLGEIFVEDAFGAVHRAHASTEGITKYLKVSDKIGVIKNLVKKADYILIGGGMSYTFLKAEGKNIGASRVEEDKIDLAKDLLKKAKDKGIKILLPLDHVCAKEFKEDAESFITDDCNITDSSLMALDIGPKTIEMYRNEILKSKTIVNNGPMGVFEFKKFATGTIEVSKALAEATRLGAITVVGGGDSASAVKKAGVDKLVSHVSTGGGASLEFLEGKALPGVVSLLDK